MSVNVESETTYKQEIIDRYSPIVCIVSKGINPKSFIKLTQYFSTIQFALHDPFIDASNNKFILEQSNKNLFIVENLAEFLIILKSTDILMVLSSDEKIIKQGLELGIKVIGFGDLINNKDILSSDCYVINGKPNLNLIQTVLEKILVSQEKNKSSMEPVKITKRHPERTDFREMISQLQSEALSLQEKGDLLGAKDKYQEAIRIDPAQPPWLYYSLVECLWKQQLLQEAINYGQQGIKLYPEDVNLHNILGLVQKLSNQTEGAITNLKKAIELDPNQPSWVYCNLSELLRTQNYLEEAVDIGTKGIKLYPEDAALHHTMGVIQDNRGDLEQVIKHYIKAIELNSQQPNWLYSTLVQRLIARNQLEEAIEYGNRSIKLYPEDANLYYHLGTALEEFEEFDDAISNYRKAIELDPNMTWVEERIAQVQYQRVEFVEEENNTNFTPKDGEYYELGRQLEAQGKLQEAVLAYLQSVAMNPNFSWSYQHLGDAQLKLMKWEESAIAYKKAIEMNPNYFWSFYNLGVACANLGRWQEAIKSYRSAIDLNPNLNIAYQAIKDLLTKRWNATFAKGDRLLQKGNRKGANRIYSSAIRTYKENLLLPEYKIPQELIGEPSVLLIVDNHLPQCLRYRVEQKIEQLEQTNFSVECFSWGEVLEAKNMIHFHHVVIFYRVPAVRDVIETIEYAKAIKKVVFYEMDDFVFDRRYYPDPLESYGGQITAQQYEGLVRGTALFKEAMASCDYGIASTPSLLKQMEKVVAKKTCFLHRNGLDKLNSEFIELNIPKIKRDYISIFYGTGTKAHNSDFDELVAPAIAKILEKYPQVRLTIMGYLTLPEILKPFQKRIDKIDIVKDVKVYWEFLRQADINIAVLHSTKVNSCKSELKWFEAACLGVPSIVSATQTYVEILEDGVDALIAATPQGWFTKLELLVTKPELRNQIAKTAYDKALAEYSVPVLAKNIENIIHSGIEKAKEEGIIVPPTTKKKLLIVNVFYPPQTIGGATRIVKDNVDILQAEYGDEYQISIFTSDEGNPKPYQINEYTHEGVRVTKVSTPMMEGMDWQYQNPQIYEIFTKYLEFNKPDLIHFHCIQRLTASVLEAAADLNIPYLVTVHDALWISDHQFLVNEKGIECDYQQNDPIVTSKSCKNLTESLKRKQYLRKQLNGSSAILAVSETFARLYRQNGFPTTQANRNGIMPRPRLPRKQNPRGKVRIAHIGGMAAHKGYFLFKEAIETLNPSNIEVIVVDHAQVVGAVRYDKWKDVPVTFIAKVPQEKMYQFYSTIDVLMAPSMWPESFGLVTREAAAAGVWVVASDKGALAEDLIEGVNGDIISVEDSDNLTNVLIKIDRDPKKYNKPVESSVTIRTTDQQVQDLVKIYKFIIN